MSRPKLFVGGLAWATNEAELRDAFASYGSLVEAVVVTDRATGQSRGFGFVTYEDMESAEKARDAMNGADLGGRSIRVDFAKERERTGGGGGGGARPRGGFGGGGGGRGGGYGGGGGGGGYGGGGGGYSDDGYRGGGGGGDDGYGGGGGGRGGDRGRRGGGRNDRGRGGGRR